MLTAARFRRAETMLQALLGVRIAEVVCAFVSLYTEQVIPDPDVMDEVTMSFVDLARRLDCAHAAVPPRIAEADATVQDIFGITLVSRVYPDEDEASGLTRLAIDDGFVAVTRGLPIEVVKASPTFAVPDAATTTWLIMVASAAASARPMPPFLYRSRSAETYDDIRDVVTAVAALPEMAGDVVMRNTERKDLHLLSPAALLLSALLTTDVSLLSPPSSPSTPPGQCIRNSPRGFSARFLIPSGSRGTRRRHQGCRTLVVVGLARLASFSSGQGTAATCSDGCRAQSGSRGPLARGRASRHQTPEPIRSLVHCAHNGLTSTVASNSTMIRSRGGGSD